MGFHQEKPGSEMLWRKRNIRVLAVSALLWWFLAIPGMAAAQNAQFTLGFPAFARDLNLLESSHSVAAVLRAASTRGLTMRGASGDPSAYRLDLSDNMSVSADFLRWSFRLKTELRFHNRLELTGEDVRFSLLRCHDRKLVPQGIRSISLRKVPPEGEMSREWVDIELDTANGGIEFLKSFPAALALCPILERESALLFEKDLGIGTNLIAAGDYALTAFKANGEIVLGRFSARTVVGESASSIVLRSFDDPTRAVTALRSGTVDALFVESAQVLEAAKGDETLLPAQCLGFQVLKRRGLDLACEGTFNLSGLRYKS